MRIPVALCLFALVLASPAMAGNDVGYDKEYDFQSAKTYSWKKGVPAAYPQVQKFIEDAIARELEEAGLRFATPTEADLFVSITAVGQTDISVTGGYIHLDMWDIGILRVDARDITTGTLLVSILDAKTEKAVWAGKAHKVFGSNVTLANNGKKVRTKIEKIVVKLFKDFPR